MSTKKVNAKDVSKNLENKSFEELELMERLLADARKKVTAKMPEKEKMEKLAGYDQDIKALQDELRLKKSLRYRLAKKLGVIQTENTDRNNKTSLYRFACIFGKGKKDVSFTIYTDTSKGKAKIPVTFRKAGKKVEKVITKADRKKAFEKIATDIGLSISEKAYNNHSTNIWLPNLIGFCNPEKISVEKKTQ